MARRKKRNYGVILMSVFIVLIMVTSVIGFIFGGNQNPTTTYNGVKFSLTDDGWKTKYEGKTYIFSYTPTDLEDIGLPEFDFKDALEIDTTYGFNSTFRQEIAAAIFELSNILYERGIYIRNGQSSNISSNIPIISCIDATQFSPVLYFKISNSTQISNDAGCITVEGKNGNDFLALVDKIAFKAIGII